MVVTGCITILFLAFDTAPMATITVFDGHKGGEAVYQSTLETAVKVQPLD
jgi:hypothetical protein